MHWLLGTQDRYTGSTTVSIGNKKRIKVGSDQVHHTGEMPDILAGVIQRAADSAGSAMLEAAGEKMKQVLASEAAKARKG